MKEAIKKLTEVCKDAIKRTISQGDNIEPKEISDYYLEEFEKMKDKKSPTRDVLSSLNTLVLAELNSLHLYYVNNKSN